MKQVYCYSCLEGNICAYCIEQASKIIHSYQKKKKYGIVFFILGSPKELSIFIDRYVIEQEEAKKKYIQVTVQNKYKILYVSLEIDK